MQYMNKKLFLFYLCCVSIAIPNYNFDIVSIYDLLKTHPDIEYIKCFDEEPFEYNPFPIARFPELHPNKGLLAESFIAKIPHGQVFSWHGWIHIDNNIIQEYIFPYAMLSGQKEMLKHFKFQNLKKITGKVAVITMPFDNCYGHWMCHVLGRLALLELHNIKYDWLYVSCDLPYMKETLSMCGVDPAKILTPFNENYYIQADEIIVPSHMGMRKPEHGQYILNESSLKIFYQKWGLPISQQELDMVHLPSQISLTNCFLNWTPLCGYYLSPWFIDYLQSKFLPYIINSKQPFAKKVFISRKDSHRHIINEDEIFKLFEPYGFKKYVLSTMSLQEQISLFHNAQTIVATNGSSLTNTLFCKPNTNIIEIFLARSDATFYYASELLQLHHYCLQTLDFIDIEGNQNSLVPLFLIQNFINEHQSLF